MAASLVESVSAGNSGSGTGATLNFAAPAVAGDLLLIVAGWRAGSFDVSPNQTLAGWERVGHYYGSAIAAAAASVYAKIAAGGEQAITMPKNGAIPPSSATIGNIRGAFGALAALQGAGANRTSTQIATLPALTPAVPGAPGILVRVDHKWTAGPSPGPVTLAGWSLLGDSGYAGFGNRQRLVCWWLDAPALAASYPALAASASGASDTGVVLTANAYGLAGGVFPGEPGGGYW